MFREIAELHRQNAAKDGVVQVNVLLINIFNFDMYKVICSVAKVIL